MFRDGALTFREFVMREPLPLATIHDAVLDFLRGRSDAVLFRAQAVNAYTDEPRMTNDIDVMSLRARDLADELCAHLAARFHIAVRVRVVKGGMGYRVYQQRKPSPRHLVDVRQVDELPPLQRVGDIQVLTPPELVSKKVMSMVARARTPKGLTDAADVRRLLLMFPELKVAEGPVLERLRAAGATEAVLASWSEVVAQEILPEDEDAEFE